MSPFGYIVSMLPNGDFLLRLCYISTKRQPCWGNRSTGRWAQR